MHPIQIDTALPFDLTSVPTWISAVAALLAVAGAVYAGRQTARIYAIESGRDKINVEELLRREALTRQAQASRVSAWYAGSPSAAPGDSVGVYAFNGSDSPVYHVNLKLDDDTSGESVSHARPVLPPMREGVLMWQPGQRINKEGIGVRVQIAFTDAQGIRWHRNRHGQLAQLPSELTVHCGDEMRGVLERFSEDFRLGYGVKLGFRSDLVGSGLRRLLVEGEVPTLENVSPDSRPSEVDAIIAPHDWLGEMVAEASIAEINLPPHGRASRFRKQIEAVMFSAGHPYGVPIWIDTMVLLRNKSLVPDEPETFNELLDKGRELRESGATSRALCVGVGQAGDPFQMWPIFAGMGGGLFGRDTSGRWNRDEIEITSPGSVAGFRTLRELGDLGTRILDTNVDQAHARKLFYSGESPYLLDMYGGFIRSDRSRTFDVGASTIPPFAGAPGSIGFYVAYGFFAGVRGNRQVASDFLPHFLDFGGVVDAIEKETNCPVIRGSRILAKSELAKACMEACKTRLPIPSFAEMPEVWHALAVAEIDAIKGGDPEEVAARAGDAIRRAFAESHLTLTGLVPQCDRG